jgi:hypothetical protein
MVWKPIRSCSIVPRLIKFVRNRPVGSNVVLKQSSVIACSIRISPVVLSTQDRFNARIDQPTLPSMIGGGNP